MDAQKDWVWKRPSFIVGLKRDKPITRQVVNLVDWVAAVKCHDPVLVRDIRCFKNKIERPEGAVKTAS